MTVDRTALKGAPWREFNEPTERLVGLPKLAPTELGRGARARVAKILRDAIGARVFRQGEAMPTPLALSNHFGCAQDTARNALMQLAAEGWVRHVPRFGVFVRGPHGSNTVS